MSNLWLFGAIIVGAAVSEFDFRFKTDAGFYSMVTIIVAGGIWAFVT